MIAMVEGAKRGKTPNEIALTILLVALTLIFLLVCATLLPFSGFSVALNGAGELVSLTVLIRLLVCLIPTTIGALPQLSALNIMRLHSPASAILSAVIFKALVIIALIPLALKGVKSRAEPASRLLSRNLLIYGVGGVIAPFIGIKAIDLVHSPII